MSNYGALRAVPFQDIQPAVTALHLNDGSAARYEGTGKIGTEIHYTLKGADADLKNIAEDEQRLSGNKKQTQLIGNFSAVARKAGQWTPQVRRQTTVMSRGAIFSREIENRVGMRQPVLSRAARSLGYRKMQIMAAQKSPNLTRGMENVAIPSQLVHAAAAVASHNPVALVNAANDMTVAGPVRRMAQDQIMAMHPDNSNRPAMGGPRRKLGVLAA